MAVRDRVALLAAGLILSGAEDFVGGTPKVPTRATACERRPGACCDFLPWDYYYGIDGKGQRPAAPAPAGGRRAALAHRRLPPGRLQIPAGPPTEDGAYLLYGRANANGVSNKRGRFGGRHVQVALHRGDPGHKGWGPFRLVEVDGFVGGRSYENLYYGAVNSVAGYLLGLFPLSSPNRHAIVASFSCDGIHFSKFLDVTHAGDAGAGRTFHQPVDGFIEEGGVVYAYVQENVRGLDMDRYDDDPLYPSGPPRVVRYGTTVAALESRARAETRGLAGC
jgi:hypothetical protein